MCLILKLHHADAPGIKARRAGPPANGQRSRLMRFRMCDGQLPLSRIHLGQRSLTTGLTERYDIEFTRVRPNPAHPGLRIASRKLPNRPGAVGLALIPSNAPVEMPRHQKGKLNRMSDFALPARTSRQRISGNALQGPEITCPSCQKTLTVPTRRQRIRWDPYWIHGAASAGSKSSASWPCVPRQFAGDRRGQHSRNHCGHWPGGASKQSALRAAACGGRAGHQLLVPCSAAPPSSPSACCDEPAGSIS